MSELCKDEAIEELESLYPPTLSGALLKVTDHLTPHYQAFVRASPFAILVTVGNNGVDCSPRRRAGVYPHHYQSASGYARPAGEQSVRQLS